MNEAIKEEIQIEYNMIMETWFSGRYYNKEAFHADKITLFKRYMYYQEEFIAVLRKGGNCFISGMLKNCPRMHTCEACYGGPTPQYLLSVINHVP